MQPDHFFLVIFVCHFRRNTRAFTAFVMASRSWSSRLERWGLVMREAGNTWWGYTAHSHHLKAIPHHSPSSPPHPYKTIPNHTPTLTYHTSTTTYHLPMTHRDLATPHLIPTTETQPQPILSHPYHNHTPSLPHSYTTHINLSLILHYSAWELTYKPPTRKT